MKNPDNPQIVGVEQTDNAAMVEFKDEVEPVIYPAPLLHAAKDLAEIMHEEDVEKDHQG